MDGVNTPRFFNRTVAAILGNLAVHGIENVHWHAAKRMLEVRFRGGLRNLCDKNEQMAMGQNEGGPRLMPEAEQNSLLGISSH